jgi:hypothetical protein
LPFCGLITRFRRSSDDPLLPTLYDTFIVHPDPAK